MLKLFLDQSVMAYTGQFLEPAFSLWRRDKAELIESVYRLFEPHNVDLSDIRCVFNQGTLDEESITVSVDNLGDYVLKITGVECAAEEMPLDNIKPFFELLQHVDNWLRGSMNNLRYDKHIFEFGGHGQLDGGVIQDFLGSFGGRRIQSVKNSLANGTVFNWLDEKTGGYSQLELNHSLDIPSGLFLRWLMMSEKDQLTFKDVSEYSLATLNKVLAEIDLEIEEAL